MNDHTSWLLELLEREGRALHALLYRLTLDVHAAEDLMQELFVKSASTKELRRAKSPSAYLRQAAIHLALDWRRTQARERNRRQKTAQQLSLGAPSTAYTNAVQREQWSQILDAAADFTGMTREVFVLHYVQGMPIEEVAEHLGKSAHQVRALNHKAMTCLREQCRPAEDAREDGSHVAR